MTPSYLLVGLGEERYALAVEDVLEVGPAPATAPLPGAPGGVLGLQNVHGEVMALLDLGSLLGLAARRPGGKTVTVEQGGRRAALSVDEILEVTALVEESGRREAPPLRASVLVDGALLGVLDTAALLDEVQGKAPS